MLRATVASEILFLLLNGTIVFHLLYSFLESYLFLVLMFFLTHCGAGSNSFSRLFVTFSDYAKACLHFQIDLFTKSSIF